MKELYDDVIQINQMPDNVDKEEKAKAFFEKVNKTNEKKSLNEKLKTGALNIGLNDKIGFIKHLFDGKNEDYERVISQINTSDSFLDAKNFIQGIVKPDYNNWTDKEDIEVRFLEIIESKFQ